MFSSDANHRRRSDLEGHHQHFVSIPNISSKKARVEGKMQQNKESGTPEAATVGGGRIR
jgi:hypothetical protein